jgi:RNA polymerase sigma-70 factor (ECF subfamily)
MADDPGMGLTQVRLLIIRSQRGDPAAFRQLVERFDRRLLYFITSLINDPEQALDVSQETWLSVFRQLPNLSSPSAFRTWVYRIAHGKSIELLRRQMRFPGTGESRELLDSAIADSDSIQLENVELVHTALSRLALHHREVLSLHFMESMSIEEMAQVLGCPPGTVKSRLHYARAAMRKTIEELTRD